ncbi:MAG: hypothetical protein RLZZ543_1963 [Bacteroidota bacterium]|jgi:hypothetical protein
MKNLFTSLLLLSAAATSMAQSAFFTPVAYRGAFAPAPAAMWTDGWCNWDPQNTDYGTPNVNVSANITSNTTWTANNVYLLQGQIYVQNNATLTIEPGTIIQGDINTAGSGLFITKGAKLIANGTVSQPIVFTSNQPAGSRNLGDWGGVILLGKGSSNSAGGIANIEGIAPTADTEFGGGATPDDNDNSGSLQYVRIEFGGYVYAPNKEINGLTFGAVGRGTTIDHVQVSFANDDAFEWFGGAVNCSHLVAYRNLDDDFDTDFGYSGNVQFCLGVRDPEISDNPTVSTSEGFESDNDAAGSALTPLTAAIFSNVTVVGPLRGDVTTAGTVATGYRRAVRIRRNSNLKIFNSIFMDHLKGVFIDGTACEANATSGAISFKHNLLAGNTAGNVCEVTSGSTFDIHAWFAASMNDSSVATTGILVTPYDYNAPDYRPAGSSPALTGADFEDAVFAGLVLTAATNVGNFDQVVLYPNPANEIIHLNFAAKTATAVSVSVTDLSGRLVMNSTSTAVVAGKNTLSINTAALQTGMYFITLSDGTSQQSFRVSVSK